MSSDDIKSDSPKDLFDPPISTRNVLNRQPIRVQKESQKILYKLEDIARRLRFLGLLASFATIANLGLLFMTLFFAVSNYPVIRLTVPYMLVSTAVTLVIVTFHEYERKIGDTLFEEINDDLQRGVRLSTSTKRLKSRKTVPTDAKYIIRVFARAADLPLIPGKFGPGIYALINIALLFLGYIVSRPF